MKLLHFCFMKKLILLPLLCTGLLHAQTVISGTVSTEGKNLAGANISIADSYDGTTSDSEGKFSFETYETGEKTLQVSLSGFENYETALNLTGDAVTITVELSEVVELKTIVFTAGQLSAKAETNKALLKPLDVVTTAGSMGDNIGALQMLPGTQNNAEDGRLFVRGGDPDETKTYIDGMKVFQPYTPTSPESPVRGRFSPFLFNGINFSTGGFGARFGDAMSGVLDMNTIDFPKVNSVDISLMSLGGGAAVNKVWEKSALSFNAQYFHLGLYNAIFESRDEWLKSPQGGAGEVVFRQKTGKGLFKTYAAYDFTDFSLKQYHLNAPNGELFALNNKNLYLNSSLDIPLGKHIDLLAGGSFSTGKNMLDLDSLQIESDSKGVFGRVEIAARLLKNLKLTTGTTADHENYMDATQYGNSGSNNLLWDVYADSEWSVTHNFGIKTGIRQTYSSALEKSYVQPRISLAYQLSRKQNFSFAYGKYAQMPHYRFWREATDLEFQSADQFLLNYLYQGEKNILRAEVYHKKYSDLITYTQTGDFGFENVANNGYGEASGLDIFWRNDNDLVKFLDFWISYSYIDSDRIYQDYPVKTQPSYVQNHNLSWVNKYWINSLRSQVGVSYKFSSGRPYTNMNSGDFLSERSQPYHSVDFNWSYLMSPQKILFFGINNVFNIKNEFGYRYSRTPNAQGIFLSEPVTPQNNQFFFVGFFWTISTDNSLNQLDNL